MYLIPIPPNSILQSSFIIRCHHYLKLTTLNSSLFTLHSSLLTKLHDLYRRNLRNRPKGQISADEAGDYSQ